MSATTHTIDPRVAAEEARYGSLDLAIEALRYDADGARWGAPVHDILNAALAEKSARKASDIPGPRSAARYIAAFNAA